MADFTRNEVDEPEGQAQVVLLNSGGLDSRVCAAMLAVESGMAVHSLFIDWVHKVSDQSRRAAERTAELFCVSHQEFSYPVDWTCFFPGVGRRGIPHTVLTSLMLGIQYAHTKGIRYVAHGVDAAYSQGDLAWVDKFRDAVNANRSVGDMTLLFPVISMSTDEVAERGRRLGAEIESSWSCLAGYPPCGTCRSCVRRRGIGLV